MNEPVCLRAQFREVLENVRYYPQAGSIRFHLEVPPHMEFRSDPTRLQIIFGNLVSNAIKYHDVTKTERWIKISEEFIADQLAVRIEDNGMGIREEVLPRVFDMFYRGNELSDGSGLGLYIVKEAVDKLNATISVKSVYGHGSEFAVSLPIAGRTESGVRR